MSCPISEKAPCCCKNCCRILMAFPVLYGKATYVGPSPLWNDSDYVEEFVLLGTPDFYAGGSSYLSLEFSCHDREDASGGIFKLIGRIDASVPCADEFELSQEQDCPCCPVDLTFSTAALECAPQGLIIEIKSQDHIPCPFQETDCQ